MSENSGNHNEMEEIGVEPPEESLEPEQSGIAEASSNDPPAIRDAELTLQEGQEASQEFNPTLDEDSDDDIGVVRTKKRVQILSDNSDVENNVTVSGSNEKRASPVAMDEKSESDPESEKSEESDGLAAIVARHKNLKLLCDEDSSEEETGENDKEANSEDDFPKEDKRKTAKKASKKERKKATVKDDGQSVDSEEELPGQSKKKSKKKSQKSEKPKKMTKREKMEEIAKRNEVYSMIQRNAREEVIEVPYNKPEQYDLKEFLSRLHERKIELPIDKKLAKKTGKLRALKSERMTMTEETEKKIDSIPPESIENIEDNSTEKLADNPDELDLLVAGSSKQIENPPNSIRLTLQGDPNAMIDLDSGLVVPKAKSKEIDLIEKCLSHNAKSTTSTESIKVESSPGVAYKLLMESLGQELLRKKREQMQKYLEDQEREKLTKIANEIDDEAEFADSDIDGEEMEETEKEEQLDEEKIESETKEDNELEKEDGEETEEQNDASDEDSETEETCDRKKKLRKRIVNVDEDSNDEDQPEKLTLPPMEDGNILLPSIEHNASVTESQMEDAEMELFNLCSGNFETQPPQSMNLPSQLGVENLPEDTDGPQDDQEGYTAPNFESSDEENPGEEKSTKKKSRKARVYLTDEDEEDGPEEPEEVLSDVPELSDQEECPQDENLAYDSEENEIDSSALPAKPKIKVTDFMENEAELSESEWGSADEDEKDLDKLEIELGDEDQFDQKQLQAELERIHMKKLLDQDAREVKMVKNLVLHEEEREGMTRERAFRWLHVDNEFNLNDRQDNPQEEARESDEENEEAWRKIRHERDVVLKDQLKEELSGLFDTKNVTILRPSIPEDPKEVKAPTFLVPERDNLNRKSLLLQDEQYLARLASLASKTSDVLVNGATEKGSFVFRQLAKQDDPETSAGKRKPDNILAPLKGKKRKKTSIYG